MSAAQSQSVHQIWKELDQILADVLAKNNLPGDVAWGVPPDPKMGHLGFPCFPFAKVMRKNPAMIAQELGAQIPVGGLIQEVRPVQAYLNVALDDKELARRLLPEILATGDKFGAGGRTTPQKWVLEYSSPNTNKPLHLGHIRNNLLGLAIGNIAAFYGHDVVTLNLVNDRGIHICKTMLAYKKWGDDKTPASTGVKGDHFVGDLYVRFDKEFKKEYETYRASGGKLSEDDYFNDASELGQEARSLLQKWESGDNDTFDLWRTMNEWVYAGFDQTYDRMGCHFDEIQYESDTYKLGKSLVDDGLDRGLMHHREDGAVVFDLEQVGLKGEKVLLRADGTSVYMTQDIGTAVSRLDKYEPERVVYVVGDEQIYHFQVLFSVLNALRPGVGEKFEHVSYGMVRLPEGKMKSREGLVVDADDLMDELQGLARQELDSRASGGGVHHADLDETELARRAERIGQAALKFFVYRFTPKKSFEYAPKKSIDFTGQTGPYCLYAYARTRSLIRKAGGPPEYDPALVDLLNHPLEGELIRMLLDYPKVVAWSAEGFDPSKIAEYAYKLSNTFARIFTDKSGYPILNAGDEQLTKARIMLAEAVGTVVRSSLKLLGIEVLEEM